MLTLSTAWHSRETGGPRSSPPPEASRARVLIAGGHEVLLDMLRSALETEFDVVTALIGRDTVCGIAREAAPAIALIDGTMAGSRGNETGARLLAAVPGIKLVYLVGETGMAAVRPSPCLMRAYPLSELLHGLRHIAQDGACQESACQENACQESACQGGRYPAPVARTARIEARGEQTTLDHLSPRQREVLALLVNGLPMKAAAYRLAITPRTVAFHKYRAMEVLGLRDNADLMRFALREGLLTDRLAG